MAVTIRSLLLAGSIVAFSSVAYCFDSVLGDTDKCIKQRRAYLRNPYSGICRRSQQCSRLKKERLQSCIDSCVEEKLPPKARLCAHQALERIGNAQTAIFCHKAAREQEAFLAIVAQYADLYAPEILSDAVSDACDERGLGAKPEEVLE
ncbi:MAG: hypothetical protein AABZ44_02925 [Elusimicrobiota bacterium]